MTDLCNEQYSIWVFLFFMTNDTFKHGLPNLISPSQSDCMIVIMSVEILRGMEVKITGVIHRLIFF